MAGIVARQLAIGQMARTSASQIRQMADTPIRWGAGGQESMTRGAGGIADVLGEEPTPEFQAMVAEQC